MIVLLLLIELIVFRLFKKQKQVQEDEIVHYISHSFLFNQYMRVLEFLEQEENFSDYSDRSNHSEDSSVSYASHNSHGTSESASESESFASSDWGYNSSEMSNYSSENE